jgi:hypothetical protein
MVAQLRTQIDNQKKELEAAAAASLEKAEEAFTKQLAEMQTLLADYQTQVWLLDWAPGVGVCGGGGHMHKMLQGVFCGHGGWGKGGCR